MRGLLAAAERLIIGRPTEGTAKSFTFTPFEIYENMSGRDAEGVYQQITSEVTRCILSESFITNEKLQDQVIAVLKEAHKLVDINQRYRPQLAEFVAGLLPYFAYAHVKPMDFLLQLKTMADALSSQTTSALRR